MLRLASPIELEAIEKGLCPHCGGDDIDIDIFGPKSACDICLTCLKRWIIYSDHRIELEIL